MGADLTLLDRILAWARTTDLVEVSYRRKAAAFDFRREGTPAPGAPAWPSSTLIPVPSPGVGIFRFSAPGRSKRIEEGASVAEGDSLGSVETGAEPASMLAPVSGRVAKVLVQDGASVEFGQPLFLLRP